MSDQEHVLQVLKHNIGKLITSSQSLSHPNIQTELTSRLGSASADTWSAALQYAIIGNQALDPELEQLRNRAVAIAAYTGVGGLPAR